MWYYIAKQQAEAEQQAFACYVADAAKIITENTAKYASGTYMKMHFADIIKPQKKEWRTGEEIAADVIRSAGLVVVE